ncbi:Protein kinase C conserved region 2 (CalB) [Balamuthia mandrillaris]
MLRSSIGMSILFEDPITFEMMDNATITKCGHTFSESTIRPFVEEHGKCPLCNQALTTAELATNYKLNEAIAHYQKYKETASKAAKKKPQANEENENEGESEGGEGEGEEGEGEEEDGEEEGEEEEDVIVIRGPVSAEELNRQINPDYKSPEDDYKLIVDVLSARNLVDASSLFSKTNPYCQLTFQKRRQQTSTKKATLSPVWNECFIFDVDTESPSERDKCLRIEIFASASLSQVRGDKFLGQAEVDWQQINSNKSQKLKLDLPLLSKSGKGKKREKVTGSVSLQLRYANLRELQRSMVRFQLIRICLFLTFNFLLLLFDTNITHGMKSEDKTKTSSPPPTKAIKVLREKSNSRRASSSASPASTTATTSSSSSSPAAASTSSAMDQLASALTDFAIDHSNDSQPEEEEEDLFGRVGCPYDNCSHVCQPHEFLSHIISAGHDKDSKQQFVCPICWILSAGDLDYRVSNDTNLYNHVRNMHSQL